MSIWSICDGRITNARWRNGKSGKKNRDKAVPSADSVKHGKGKKEKPKESIDSVVIDFDNLYLRARRLTSGASDENLVAIHPKGDKFYFVADVKGKRDIFSTNRFGEEWKNVTEGGTNPSFITMDSEGKTFYFLKNGAPSTIGTDGGKSEGTSFHASLKIDLPNQRLEVIDEGWRGLGRGYYDPTMHGADWSKMRAKYRAYAERVYHDRDFEDVVEMMLGELNSSHTGYNMPRSYDQPSYAGELGLEFDRTYSGNGLKVKRVVPYGPCDRIAMQVKPDDILLSIDGQPVSPTEPVSRPLESKANEPVLLGLQRNREALELTVTPVDHNSLRQRVYEAMEESNRQQTDSLSRKRLGYIHIQGMGYRELELFQRDLFAACNGKEGLLIDVRNNGGGSTADMLLTILTQPQHAYTIGRDGGIGYPQDRLPLYRWNKPVVVLCNEASYSNAEIFGHAIKTLKRGVVVGAETAGGVISTGGWTTLDNGSIRLPMRGWYIYGTKLEEENRGCVPDYPVPYTPGHLMKGQDPQLEKAVEVGLRLANEERLKPGQTGEVPVR